MIARYRPEHVFVLAGDHIYTMDYGRMLAAHLDSGAVLTVGFIGRLVAQKGVDLLLEALPDVLERTPLRFVALGSGQERFAQGLEALARAWPQRVFVRLGYDEPLAHRIEAGCDVFVMPSRFEPCELNQMYSMRYGTPPVVHAVGGLRDTVVDTRDKTLAAGTATGFVFTEASAPALAAAQAAESLCASSCAKR